jgi:hypothetical protein
MTTFRQNPPGCHVFWQPTTNFPKIWPVFFTMSAAEAGIICTNCFRERHNLTLESQTSSLGPIQFALRRPKEFSCHLRVSQSLQAYCIRTLSANFIGTFGKKTFSQIATSVSRSPVFQKTSAPTASQEYERRSRTTRHILTT